MALLPISLAPVRLIGIRPLQRIHPSYLSPSTSKSPFVLSVRDMIPFTSSLTVRLSRLSLLATLSLMSNFVDWIRLPWDLPLSIFIGNVTISDTVLTGLFLLVTILLLQEVFIYIYIYIYFKRKKKILLLLK